MVAGVAVVAVAEEKFRVWDPRIQGFGGFHAPSQNSA